MRAFFLLLFCSALLAAGHFLHADEPTPEPSPAPSRVSMGTGGEGKMLASRQAQIQALLVRSNDHGLSHGITSRLTATALRETEAVLQFNQEVGDDMNTALGEVGRFIRHRLNGWPEGEAVTFGFKLLNRDG